MPIAHQGLGLFGLGVLAGAGVVQAVFSGPVTHLEPYTATVGVAAQVTGSGPIRLIDPIGALAVALLVLVVLVIVGLFLWAIRWDRREKRKQAAQARPG